MAKKSCVVGVANCIIFFVWLKPNLTCDLQLSIGRRPTWSQHNHVVHSPRNDVRSFGVYVSYPIGHQYASQPIGHWGFWGRGVERKHNDSPRSGTGIHRRPIGHIAVTWSVQCGVTSGHSGYAYPRLEGYRSFDTKVYSADVNNSNGSRRGLDQRQPNQRAGSHITGSIPHKL